MKKTPHRGSIPPTLNPFSNPHCATPSDKMADVVSMFFFKFWGHVITKLPGPRSPASKSGYLKALLENKENWKQKKMVFLGFFLVEKVAAGKPPSPNCTQAQSQEYKNRTEEKV